MRAKKETFTFRIKLKSNQLNNDKQKITIKYDVLI